MINRFTINLFKLLPDARSKSAENMARSSSLKCMVLRLSAKPNNNSKNTARLKSVAETKKKHRKKYMLLIIT